MTTKVLAFQVSAKSNAGGDVTVDWRRTGAGLTAYGSGAFTNQAVFHVNPGDVYVRLNLKTSQSEVLITIQSVDA
jgi:hypothetical protein